MKITYSQLRQLGACKFQLAEFKTRFGQEVEVTEAGCLEVATVFNWNWAAQHLLTASALAEYDRVRASALAEYDRVTASALAEYDRVRASAFAKATLS